MIRSWRFAFALLTGVAAACVPILGLDDLEPRPTQAQTDSGNETGADSGDAGSCTTHAECIKAAFNNPARCVKNKCVKADVLELCNQDVVPSLDVFGREDTIVVAAFMQGTNPQITGAGRAYSMALEELEAAGGILGRTKRHLAVLICKADPAVVDRGVKHVINDLQVPAIIASFGSGDLAELVAGDVVNAGVFTINPSFTTNYLKYAPTNGLVWSLLGTGEDVALAYRPVLQQLRAEKGLGPDTKVALIATNGSLDQRMADVVHFGPPIRTGAGGNDPTKALDMLDGKTPEQDPAHFKRFRIDSLQFPKPPDFEKTLADAKRDLIAFGPDVIIALTGPEIDSFMVSVDDAILLQNKADSGAEAGAPKKGPYWILGPSNGELVRGASKTELGSYVDPDAGGVDSRRARIIGVQFAGALETKERDLFRERMNIRNKDASAEGLAHENFYDAIYWLAYGIAAVGQNPQQINGQAFADGVRKLYRGTPEINPGEPSKLEFAFEQINEYPTNGTLFVGALGRPDINEPTGTWNSVGATYCYPPYQELKPAPTYDVRRYSPDAGLLPGSKPLTCSN